MELCAEVIDGLSLFNSTQLTDKLIDGIFNNCEQILLRQNTEQLSECFTGHQTDQSLNKVEYKLLSVTICTIMLECVKWNCSDESLVTLCNENGVNNRNRDKLVAFYRTIKSQLKSILSEQRLSSLPNIIDCYWNQYIIKGYNKSKINEYAYIINVKCDSTVDSTDNDNNDSFTFEASLPELQDLCAKLRDCCKVVDKIIK